MKFNDGFWRLQKGMTALRPRLVRRVQRTDRTITAFAPTRPIENRRQSLNNPVVTVRLWSPSPGVIGVRLWHHGGVVDNGGGFALSTGDTHDVTTAVLDDLAVLESGDLRAELRIGEGWSLTFWSGDRMLTSSDAKSVGFVETEDGRHYAHERLSLDIGEHVYGLGERSTALVKNGQAIDSWNDDGGPSSDHSYKNVPFYLTDKAYGVFVNSTDRVAFEVGSEFVSRAQFSVPGQSLEYFVVGGGTPKEVLNRYTALTGRPALPPAWSLGLWLSTSFVTDYDEETVTSFVDEMQRRELPLSVFHFDSFWMREFHWCDFEWDPEAFPDPAGMLRRLHARGLRVSVWINPYVAEQSALFAEGKDHGYFLTRENGDVWQWDTWQAGMAIVDFTNPAAREWFAAKLTALLHMGVDCFKTDFGERIPTDAVYFDGSDATLMHNYYSYLYNQTVFEVLEKARGRGDAVLFARSATAGGQQFPVHWGGDPEPTYVAMAESLRAGLSLGLSGFGFWSHDIGGFEGSPPPGLFKRWAAFGLLSSHSRLHGSVGYRVPWVFGDEAVEVVRTFTRLKMRLMPYLYQAARQAALQGTPMMRSMMLEFPGDEACAHLDRQYMLGEHLIVAPIFNDEGAVSFYVPAGAWTDIVSGDVLTGPGWVRQHHGFSSMPILARPGAVIATGARDDRPDYDHADGVTLEVFRPFDGLESEVTVGAGPVGDARFELDCSGDTLTVRARSPYSWRVRVVGVTAVSQADGEQGELTQRGILFSVPEGTESLQIRLA